MAAWWRSKPRHRNALSVGLRFVLGGRQVELNQKEAEATTVPTIGLARQMAGSASAATKQASTEQS
jgi:hypothetical protein